MQTIWSERLKHFSVFVNLFCLSNDAEWSFANGLISPVVKRHPRQCQHGMSSAVPENTASVSSSAISGAPCVLVRFTDRLYYHLSLFYYFNLLNWVACKIKFSSGGKKFDFLFFDGNVVQYEIHWSSFSEHLALGSLCFPGPYFRFWCYWLFF